MLHIRKAIFLILFALFISPTYAGHYIYKQLSVNESVPSTVQCIHAEKNGYVWIGTKNGLERFDGYELKQYNHHDNDPYSIPHNSIHKIYQDDHNAIWILTDKGVAQYCPKNDYFIEIKDKNGQYIEAFSILETSKELLFGGRNKIYNYNRQDSIAEIYTKFNSESNFTVNSLYHWDNNTFLCGSRWQGSLLVDIKSGKTKKTSFDCGTSIRSIYVDSKNRIWIASYNNGVVLYNNSGELIRHYNTKNSNLNNDVILCIIERDDMIWMGTDGGGINILNPENNEIEILERIPGNNYSLPVNSVLYLYNDAYDNVWAGTIRGGLIYIREASMKTYTDVILGGQEGLSERAVISLYQRANDNNIWIGTDGGGINKYNTLTGRFTHYPNMWGTKIASICHYKGNQLFLSLFSKGVFVFDTHTGQLKEFPVNNKNLIEQMCYKGKTVNLYRESEKSLLFLTDSIYRYDFSTNQLKPLINKDEKYLLGTVLPIGTINNDFYLHDDKNIFKLSIHADTLTKVIQLDKGIHLNAADIDNNQIFWLATNQDIQKIDLKTGKIEHIKPPTQEQCQSILCDKKGKVWIGVGQDIYTWLINEKKFILYGQSDGVSNNEYLPKPRILANNGDVYLGGANGLLHISRDLPIIFSDVPSLKLINVMANGKKVVIDDKQKAAITLPCDTRDIAIRVMALENEVFRSKTFRFQIQGYENGIIETTNPELIVRSLPTGDYRINVSCSTKNGEWTPSKTLLNITILAPWYQSWWFNMLIIVLVLIIVVAIFVYTLRQKENKMKWSMKEHEKKIYEDKVRFLININHELRTPLTLIYAPIKRLLVSMNTNNEHYPIVQSVYRQSHRMIELLNMVLDMRKMEVQETTIHIEPYDLNEWVKSYTGDFELEAKSKGIKFNYQFEQEIELVSFDKDKCLIILNNLLINALKYSPDQTEITIKTEYSSEKSMVRVSIVDQGCGVDENDIEKLFDRFYQGNNSQGGTGIGLSYSKMLIELHHGNIGVYNNPTKGATFYIELPYQTEKQNIKHSPKPYINEYIGANEKLNPNNPTKNDLSILTNYSLLIVDDNEDLLDFIYDFMKPKFKTIYAAKNGVEALKLIRTHTPDIVVSDIMMPLMDGYELCKEIKQTIDFSHLLVILLTARNDEQSRLLGYKNGADGYLTKPFEPDTLLEMIVSRLKNRDIIKGRYLEASILPKPEDATFSSADETFLLKFNNIIIENISNPDLEVSFICKEMAMSRASLYNKLKALTSMSINEYINKYRMEKAITLILQSELSFTEIAEQTGFSTSRYFSTTFKQYTGLTPTQYRNQNK